MRFIFDNFIFKDIYFLVFSIIVRIIKLGFEYRVFGYRNILTILIKIK